MTDWAAIFLRGADALRFERDDSSPQGVEAFIDPSRPLQDPPVKFAAISAVQLHRRVASPPNQDELLLRDLRMLWQGMIARMLSVGPASSTDSEVLRLQCDYRRAIAAMLTAKSSSEQLQGIGAIAPD